jgi:hypothetical protein
MTLRNLLSPQVGALQASMITGAGVLVEGNWGHSGAYWNNDGAVSEEPPTFKPTGWLYKINWLDGTPEDNWWPLGEKKGNIRRKE